MALPTGVAAAVVARQRVRVQLTSWGLTGVLCVDAICAVVHELVTNAVLHAGGCREVGVRIDGPRVVVHVVDGNKVMPRERPGHFGLLVVGSASSQWGVDLLPFGKRIWAVIDCHPDLSA